MPGVYEDLNVAPFNRVRKTSKTVSDTFALRLAKKTCQRVEISLKTVFLYQSWATGQCPWLMHEVIHRLTEYF